MKDIIKYFFEQGKKVDIQASVQEETRRYSSAPKHATQNENKFKQWFLIQIVSKWEFLGRQKWMTRDKFE